MSKQVELYEPTLDAEAVRRLVRQFHEEKRTRIQSLLDIKDKLQRNGGR